MIKLMHKIDVVVINIDLFIFNSVSYVHTKYNTR